MESWGFFCFLGILLVASCMVATLVGLGAFGGTYFTRRHSRRPYLPALLVSVLVFVVTCGLVFWGIGTWAFQDRAGPRTRPGESDLSGIWSLTLESVTQVQSSGWEQAAAGSLTLRSDGTFDMVNMPDPWPDLMPLARWYYSGTGSWAVKRLYGDWWVELQFAQTPHPTGELTALIVGQDGTGFYLYSPIILESGDAWMVLRKQ